MIRVLHIVSSLASTGVPTLLYSYYSNMDRTKIQFDFVSIPGSVKHEYKEKFERLGSRVFYMPKSYGGRIPYLYSLMKNGHYDIVHSHIELASAIYLAIAKFAGIKKRYAHAHMAFLPYSKLYQKVLRYLLNKVTTQKIGCSKDALSGLFGTKDGTVLHNAIDIERFEFSSDIREKYRSALHLNGYTVLGFVGRFTFQKNVFYLLEIFREYEKLNHKTKLLIAGDGELKDDFISKVKDYNLNDKIIYLGPRSDISQLMMAMDCLLLPSRWEGLGIVLIEAQAAALMSYTSRDTVPYEDTHISEYIKYLKITEKPSLWAKSMYGEIEKYSKHPIREKLIDANYDIKKQASKLFDLYN